MKKDIQFKLIVLLLLAAFTTSAQDFRRNRIEKKSFAVGELPELKVVNKYGRIQLIPWKKDSIRLEVSIEVRAKKESKADEVFNDLKIDFVHFQSYVESKSSYSSQSSFWGDVKEKSSAVFSSDNKTQVDYKIYLPPNTHLTIENKYGDVFIADHTGSVNLDLSNGDLKAGSFSGPTTIKLDFAYANINSIKSGTIIMDHKSELQLDEATNLKLESRSSRISIGRVVELGSKSYRDKYSINSGGTLEIDASYSFYTIRSLTNTLKATTRYGSLDIDELKSGVKKLDFNVENTDIGIFKPEDRSITIEAIYSEQAGLFFPSELVNKKTTKEDDEKKLVKTIGMVGNSFVSPIKLNIIMPTGNLRIK